MAVLSPSQRIARWKAIVYKVLIVINVHAVKERVTAALGGRDNYLRIFQQVKTPQLPDQPLVTRIIDGEVVGRPLPTSKGQSDGAELEPAMCQHPSSKMKKRGNKAQKWWTCTACLQRWERKELEEYHPKGEATDTDLITFGPRIGQTYLEVLQDPMYCQLILLTVETDPASSPQIKRLARYIVQNEWQRIEKPAPSIDDALL